MPRFMIALILYMYINLLYLSWIKMSIFEEYGAFNHKKWYHSVKDLSSLYHKITVNKGKIFKMALRLV